MDTAHQLLFSASPQNRDPSRDNWKRDTSYEEHKKAGENGNSTASVHKAAAHLDVAFFAYQNESSDWVNYSSYCYRSDGTLAEIHSRLNSFHGDMTVVRDYFFDPRGKQIALDRENFALGTTIPKPIDPAFWDFPPPIFPHVTDLPFAKLLR